MYPELPDPAFHVTPHSDPQSSYLESLISSGYPFSHMCWSGGDASLPPLISCRKRKAVVIASESSTSGPEEVISRKSRSMNSRPNTYRCCVDKRVNKQLRLIKESILVEMYQLLQTNIHAPAACNLQVRPRRTNLSTVSGFSVEASSDRSTSDTSSNQIPNEASAETVAISVGSDDRISSPRSTASKFPRASSSNYNGSGSPDSLSTTLCLAPDVDSLLPINSVDGSNSMKGKCTQKISRRISFLHEATAATAPATPLSSQQTPCTGTNNRPNLLGLGSVCQSSKASLTNRVCFSMFHCF
ncbi:uncharacterized protein LOC9310373 isoform X1 [Arabidopsis lyrata subsp. lyrata]|uniref:uncharacterized protein LOC9310373 isoform X1 n=1 Tax=Arabidopsis lyrata subsp. lyrata TaxID=81972 RepID=UPI000A29B7C3|nr:uncharacterized protein LOC9310373 isoform X1 [Arabidopsis lyrata subsp. lyrata]|eukprot:XP_020879316.1 uncharacterized protein LOC9310373 isoform X1 [Arabidopsis lyrata subsp. lyrata]